MTHKQNKYRKSTKQCCHCKACTIQKCHYAIMSSDWLATYAAIQMCFYWL